ncbi:hypothetical protein [Hymenobacter sp. B81]|uniref:hypothetical protein n=1 Tax=Hymenobacter sp. B81 TaxID=3344878 RepID=UPI0037DC2A9B
MKVFDLLLTAGLDLQVRGGDLELGESTEQHLALLLHSEKGDWRQTPFAGVGLRTLLLDDAAPVAIIQEIQAQLELDGVDVSGLTLGQDGALNVQGTYKDTDG